MRFLRSNIAWNKVKKWYSEMGPDPGSVAYSWAANTIPNRLWFIIEPPSDPFYHPKLKPQSPVFQIKSNHWTYCTAVWDRLLLLGRSADAEVIDQHLGMKSRTRLTTLSGSWTVLRLKAFVNQLLKTEDWSMGQTDTLDGIEKWWRVRLPEVQ
jgi:hypothetical protein